MEKTAQAPKPIWYSLYAFLATIVVVVGFSVPKVLRYEIGLRRWDVKVYLLESAIVLLLILLTFRRKGWARTVYAVLTGLLLLGMFVAVLARLVGLVPMRAVLPLGAYDLISSSLQLFLRVLSVYFLYTRQSREWFKPPRVENDHVQSGTGESMCDSNALSHDYVQSVVSPLNRTSRQALPPTSDTVMATPQRFRLRGMKKRTLLAGGSALSILGICLLVVFVHSGHRATKVDAIRRALSADVTLARQVFGNRTMAQSDATIIQAYTQGLRRIDMSRCPRDFQMAYLEHIQAWESLARSRDSVDLLGPLFELLVQKRIPNIPDSPDERPVRDEIAKTWDRIERIALSYGVRVPE